MVPRQRFASRKQSVAWTDHFTGTRRALQPDRAQQRCAYGVRPRSDHASGSCAEDASALPPPARLGAPGRCTIATAPRLIWCGSAAIRAASLRRVRPSSVRKCRDRPHFFGLRPGRELGAGGPEPDLHGGRTHIGDNHPRRNDLLKCRFRLLRDQVQQKFSVILERGYTAPVALH